MKPLVIAHGGVSTPESDREGVEQAAEEGYRVLSSGGTALEAAVAAVVVMEDDGRYDAGTGSYYNLDGKIEMDAAVMDEKEQCGAVGAISSVKNPILVAMELINTPHILLVGEGALRFARGKNFLEFEPGTDRTRQRLEEVKKKLAEDRIPEWASRWKDYTHPGTVGAAVYDGKGGFGTANSTGGTSYQMPGRVGDSALIGCGLYASKQGAVVTTGIGEDIIEKVLAKSIYDKVCDGLTPQDACDWGVGLYSNTIPIGAIAITESTYGISANDVMPTVVKQLD